MDPVKPFPSNQYYFILFQKEIGLAVFGTSSFNHRSSSRHWPGILDVTSIGLRTLFVRFYIKAELHSHIFITYYSSLLDTSVHESEDTIVGKRA